MSGAPDNRDIDAEIDFHLRELTEALMADGWDKPSARAEAARRYGNRRRHAAMMQRAHQSSEDRRLNVAAALGAAVQELRFAVRGLRRAPAFTLTAITTLALVAGANLTMFGIADGVIFKPLAYLRDPSAVHRVYWQWQNRGRQAISSSTQFPRFLDLQRDTASFSGIAVFADRSVPIGEGTHAQQRRIAAVSASYFDFFEAAPVRGRFFTAVEDVIPRGADVAVLGHRFWRSAFGGREVIGDVLRIGDIRATIIGVAPEGFDGLNDGVPPAAFVPITTYAASTGTDDSRTYFSAYKWGWVHVLVRRAPGVNIRTATADATRMFRATWPRIVDDNRSLPDLATADPRVILSAVRTGGGPAAGPNARTSLWLLAIAVIVLLIGCANVAGLSLIRAHGRRRDVRLKRALGISGTRLLMAALAEAAVLAVIAGGVSLVVAQVLRSALAPILRSLQIAELSVFSDARTLIATGVLALIATCVIGLMSAMVLRRRDLAGALAGGARGGTSEGRRLRATLLAAQAMLSIVLLVGAGLFVRSLIAVNVSPLGYDPARVVLMNRVIPPGRFDATKQRVLRQELLRAAGPLPSVESVAWMSSAPFVSTSSTDVFVPGLQDANALGPFTFQATTEDYFRTMGTRILRGRRLTAEDRAGSPEVAVISEDMAQTLWPGRDAIGQCFYMRSKDSPCRRVVGVAEDMVQSTLADGPRLHYYVPIDQYPRAFGNGLIVKLRDDSDRVAEETRLALQRVMPAGSYLVSQRLAAIVASQRSSWRMGATVLGGFALLALLVAGVGLYGAVAHDIAQRRQDWAIRVALGADRRSIMTLVIGGSVRAVLAGVIPGLFIAAAFGNWVRPLLYRTSGVDPVSYIVAAGTMLGVAVVAGTVPAWRASRLDPSAALRSE
ncbi:MAG: ABC transporter permease [Vicinamibacterales bacterium]